MKILIYKCALLSFCLLAAGLFAQEEVKNPETGTAFPKTISFSHEGNDYTLDITGTGTRKKFFIKVYSIGSYLQQGGWNPGEDKIAAILDGSHARQLTMIWLRAVGTNKIKEGYYEGFGRELSKEEFDKMKPEIDKFISFHGKGSKAGDEQILRYAPGGYFEMILNGEKVGSITNEQFANTLWKLWFSKKSAFDKNELTKYLQ